MVLREEENGALERRHLGVWGIRTWIKRAHRDLRETRREKEIQGIKRKEKSDEGFVVLRKKKRERKSKIT